MSELSSFRTREAVFTFLDEYAFNRKEQIDRRKLDKDAGLIKSYVLETAATNGKGGSTDIPTLLRGAGWQATSVEKDNNLYFARDERGELGFIESISSRHLVLHTYLDSKRTDQAVQKNVKEAANLDFLWLSGGAFSTLWEHLVRPQMPERFVTFKFEHDSYFDRSDGYVPVSRDLDWVSEESEETDETEDEVIIEERRASKLAITERSRQLGEYLPELQRLHPAFKAIKMMRMPASTTRGGYEFWSWGKVTHRAPSFRDGREQVISITRMYERATARIEQAIWFQVERHTIRDFESVSLTGAPVTLEFSQPLSPATFQNLVTTTFDDNQGPLRLWGNPIWLGDQKVHVYGIDLHLWQRIYLEITPRRMLIILPRGTCGNTVHRLVTNVQRVLDPSVRVFVGDVDYLDLLRHALLGEEA